MHFFCPDNNTKSPSFLCILTEKETEKKILRRHVFPITSDHIRSFPFCPLFFLFTRHEVPVADQQVNHTFHLPEIKNKHTNKQKPLPLFLCSYVRKVHPVKCCFLYLPESVQLNQPFGLPQSSPIPFPAGE